MRSRLASLRTKLVMVMGSLILPAFALTGGLTAQRVRGNAEGQAIKYMQSQSMQYANQAKALVEVPLDAVRTLAQTLPSIDQIPTQACRPYVIDALRRIVETNPDFLGAWFVAEPEGLGDGDKSCAGMGGSAGDSQGRFTAYYYRTGSGIEMEVGEASDDYGGPYYAVPKVRKAEYVTEPYLEELDDGSEVWMFSLAAPVIQGNTVIGVVGIDIRTETVGQGLSDVKL